MRVSPWLTLLGCALAGCINPQLMLCQDGRACANAEVCDDVHHLCVNPDQVSACAGRTDGTPCAATAHGECFDQVCLTPGCGNSVVETSESCDDGNRVGGDGCSSDCTSDERCGNAVTDPGEQCDDGNLISHDGCDSRCQTEAALWTAYPMQLPSTLGHQIVFDPVHARAVLPTQSTTWQWDGQGWQVTMTPASGFWDSVVYDADRQVTVAFGRTQSSPMNTVVGEWDGTTWTVTSPAGQPSTVPLSVYDHARHKILTLTGTGAQYYDPASATWEAVFTMPFTATYQTSAAYDEQRGRVVVLVPPDPNISPAPPTVTWEWDGSTWTTTASAPAAYAGWAMTYDGARGGVVAVGGLLRPGYSGAVYLWNGSTWTNTGASITPCASAAVWFDSSRGSLFGAGGFSASNSSIDVWELAGTTLSDHSTLYTGGTPTLAYDAARDRVLVFDGTGAAWRWDGSWHVAGTGSFPPGALAYDPVRAGVVAFDAQSYATWLFRDGWEQIVAPESYSFVSSMVYDYANRRMLRFQGLEAYALASDATSWVASTGPDFTLGSTAYDLGNQCPAGLGESTDQTLNELIGGQWVSTLSPGNGFRATAWFARRSVVLYPAGGSFGMTPKSIWELRGTTWGPLGQLPFPFASPSSAERSRGRLLFVATAGATTLVELQLASGLADETCAPGEDADGDGLSGCNDPDCWQTCWPACPFATSCP